MTRRSQAEKVADYLGSDIADVRAHRYQPSRYHSPQLFAFSCGYYCASDAPPRYPLGEWQAAKNFRGESIYFIKL
jgi:hypothetical protein